MPVFAFPADAAEMPSLLLERFVFDNRFAAAVELARHVASHGVPLAETSGDLMHLWYDDLDLQWKRAPMALAGMTTRGGLFVLETLAADRQMRVVYRGEHAVPQDGTVRHLLIGPADLIARTVPNADTFFWKELSASLFRCPRDQRRTTEIALTTQSELAWAHEESLFSWIIAPRSQEARV